MFNVVVHNLSNLFTVCCKFCRCLLGNSFWYMVIYFIFKAISFLILWNLRQSYLPLWEQTYVVDLVRFIYLFSVWVSHASSLLFVFPHFSLHHVSLVDWCAEHAQLEEILSSSSFYLSTKRQFPSAGVSSCSVRSNSRLLKFVTLVICWVSISQFSNSRVSVVTELGFRLVTNITKKFVSPRKVINS